MANVSTIHKGVAANFYLDHIVSHADYIYRFAYVLTLSSDTAWELVQKVFQNISQNLTHLVGSESFIIRKILIKECWHLFQKIKLKPSVQGRSLLTDFAIGLSQNERVVLSCIDILGFTCSQVAEMFQWNEEDIRQSLIGSRKKMVMTFSR